MTAFQYITAVHGDEYQPVLALASQNKAQLVANPRALSRKIRFIDSDLNASFGLRGSSYERRRASEVLKQLDKKKLIVDFHTFSCVSAPFVVIVDLEMLPLAASLGIPRVVYMQHNIKKGHALINYRSGVSVEVGKHDDRRSFVRTLQIINRLETYDIKPRPIRLYEVFGTINKPGKYVNFKQNKKFTPVLTGEKAYEINGCYGLRAREIKIKKVL